MYFGRRLSRIAAVCFVLATASGISGAEMVEKTKAMPGIPATATWEVGFPSGGTALNAEARTALNEVAKELKSNKTATVNIAGHADNSGTSEGNRRIALRRAEAVGDYLVSRGVARKRVTAVGFGDLRPKADNATPEGRAANRRAEVIVTMPEAGQDMVLSSFAIVVDDEGQIMKNLSSSNFKVFQGEEQREIVGVTYVDESYPSAVVLAVDKSASAKEALPAIKNATKAFIDAKKPNDPIQVIAFSSNIEMGSQFSTDADDLKKAIDGIQAHGFTRLYDALYLGSKALGSFPPPRVLVLLTDGRDEHGLGKPGSDATLDQALFAAKANRVTVITVGLGADVDHETLKTIALSTEGGYYYAQSPDKLADIYRQISKGIIRGKYRIDFKGNSANRLPVVVSTSKGRLLGFK